MRCTLLSRPVRDGRYRRERTPRGDDEQTSDAVAVLDDCTPRNEGTKDVVEFWDNPVPGLAYRVDHEGNVGETLLLRLFSVDRLQGATIGME